MVERIFSSTVFTTHDTNMYCTVHQSAGVHQSSLKKNLLLISLAILFDQNPQILGLLIHAYHVS